MIALLALAGSLAVAEYLAGAVIAVMLTGGPLTSILGTQLTSYAIVVGDWR